MLAKNKDIEERNGHIKGVVIVLVAIVIALAIPNLMFQLGGIGDDGCTTLESGEKECLEADNPIDQMILDGKDKGLLYYNYAVVIGGICLTGYKLFQV